MKLWIPALLLLTLFVGATLWQSLWTSDLRQQRDEAWERAARGSRAAANRGTETTLRRRGSDQARILVGRPSGAAPVQPPEPPRPRGRLLDAGTPDVADGGIARGEAPADGAWIEVEPDFTMEVQSGQSLSIICQQHYGTARPELVRSLAEYNGLASPDMIRVGQTLYLPSGGALLGADGL